MLFGDLSDFTAWAEDLDPERVGEVTDRVLAALARVVVEVGGHVDKLTGDGIMAVFGAPTAHEDDAERAVRAAVNMQHEVRQLVADELGGGRRLGLRVGLNTGEVLAGVQAALAYTVVGDTVNTASRLSDAASVGVDLRRPGDRRRHHDARVMARAAPLRLKGKREPVAAYELVALRPTSAGQLGLGDEAPFVGRETEVARLVGASLDITESGRPATICVTGEAGVGKTRTVGELVRFAGELPDARVLSGRAMPYGEGRHLAPLVESCVPPAASPTSDEPEVAVERVRRTLARLDTPASSLLGARRAGRPAAPPARHRRTSARRAARDGAPGRSDAAATASLDAVGGLLRALAAEGRCWSSRRPAVGQRRAARAIGEMAKRLRGPILLVLVGRERLTIAGLPSAAALDAGAAGRVTAHQLLRAYLGGAELAEPLRSAMLGRAQGNPYFLAELLHLLVDRGLLLREGDAWVASGPLPDEALPAAVQSVLAARIDGLDPRRSPCCARHRCSGCGSRLRRCRVVEQRPEDEVQAALRELSARQLLARPEGETLVDVRPSDGA